jgi:hypothetical protein
MAESENARKKRLAKQSKAAKAGRKPSTKKAQDASRKETAATRSTEDTNINRMIELGLPIPETTRPEPKPQKKKAAAKPKREGPAEAPVVDVAPKSGEDWKQDNEKNTAFEEVQKEQNLNEIGALGKEATPSQRKARAAKLEKYSGQIAEINTSTVPRNEVDTAADPLRPRITEEDPTPTPAQAAARAAKTAPGTSGTGIYTFDAPRPAETPRQDVDILKARRQAKGLPGLPGDENGINDLALGLAKRDYAIAKTTNKIVNEMDPEGDEPTHIDPIYYGHHRRLAEVMLRGGLTEDHIAKSAQGSGRTFESKVKYLHQLLQKHDSARDAEAIDLKGEGITHWIHPTTGVAHPIADNHPDMPKMQPPQVAGGDMVGHGFWRGGKEERVRKDQNTGSWVTDKNTGNADIDATLGWNPDKEVGFYTVNLRGGIKALKQNIAPTPGRSLWEHEVNNMKSEFPQSVSGDSRLQHRAYANRILQDASKSEVDGRVLARNRAGEPVPKINRRTGKLAGMIVGSGRSVQMGFTVDENGEATQTTGTVTSRARTAREGAPFPTKEFGASGYSEGGSTRIDTTTEQPERTKIVEFQNKKQDRKKTTVRNGKKILNPPVSGVPGGGGVLIQKRESAFIPKTATSTPSQQFAAMMPTTAPSWDRPTVLPHTSGEGFNIMESSDAQPITKGKATYTKTVVPDPEAVKKNPKSKKTITKIERKEGMVDQMIPGMENAGVPEVPTRKPGPSREYVNVEGPITEAQLASEKAVPNPKSQGLREGYGKVRYLQPAETPIAESAPTMSTQLATVAGNAPVDRPVAEGPARTVLSYRKNRMEAPAAAPAAPAAPKEEPEQMSFEGMEPTNATHAGGRQWLSAAKVERKTSLLQRRARTAGVPGGANPINVTRGTEAPKSNRSFKK